jgi:hypothetical protein
MNFTKVFLSAVFLSSGIALAAAPCAAQMRTVDPNNANADLAPVPSSDGYSGPQQPSVPPMAPAADAAIPADSQQPGATAQTPAQSATGTAAANTYQRQDVISAAEGVFGRGAEGLAKLIESILKDQGEPNAYIAGREAGGAIALGLRYGSGTLYHKVEGQQPIYWTGPSLGFDLGANGSKTFMLVYNLYDSNDVFKRFPGGEGAVYVVGGFNASYQRRGDIVVIPIRLGVGWRLGANVGYLKFSKESRILPF